jgi:hypothetical protein
VFQKKFEWFVSQEGGAIPFFSGMRLNWRFWGFWEFYEILNSQKPWKLKILRNLRIFEF